MRVLSVWGRTFIKGLSSLEYYQDVVKAKLSFAVKYVIILGWVMATLVTVRLYVTTFRNSEGQLKRFVAEQTKLFPVELVISVRNGKLSTNVEEPYVISFEGKPFITIDTQVSTELFEKVGTPVLVTENNVMMARPNRSYEKRIYSLEKVDDFTLDRQRFNSLVTDKLGPFLIWLPKLLMVVIWLGAGVGVTLVKFMWVAMVTGLVWVGVKLAKVKLTYKQLMQMGLVAVTLVWLVEEAFGWLKVGKPFGGFYTLMFLVWMGVIVGTNRKAWK